MERICNATAALSQINRPKVQKKSPSKLFVLYNILPDKFFSFARCRLGSFHPVQFVRPAILVSATLHSKFVPQYPANCTTLECTTLTYYTRGG